MPIYEYRCGSCGAELEKLQKISDPPLSECPECGKQALAKLVSASSFRLKGSGWYETDFKTGSKKNGAGESPAEGSAEGSKQGTTGGAASSAASNTAASSEPAASAGAGNSGSSASNGQAA